MSNFSRNKKSYNDAFFYCDTINHTGKRSLVDNNKIKIVGTKPSIKYKFCPIGIQNGVPHAGL